MKSHNLCKPRAWHKMHNNKQQASKFVLRQRKIRNRNSHTNDVGNYKVDYCDQMERNSR